MSGTDTEQNSEHTSLVGIICGLAFLLVVGFLFAAGSSSPGGRPGSNTTLYRAVGAYHVGITTDEADAYVRQIAVDADLSRRSAEEHAVRYARLGLPASLWVKMASTEEGCKRIPDDGADTVRRCQGLAEAVAAIGR